MAERPAENLPDTLEVIAVTNSGGDFSNKREWNNARLEAYIGGFSRPSKMPGLAFGIPAETCNVGSKLRQKAGTVCSGCYAYKGAYAWSTTKLAYWRRFDRLTLPFWAEAIATILNRRVARKTKNAKFFRFHDSGDILSVEHLLQICKVAELCPEISFWIPTREYKTVAQFLKLGHKIPANLAIRMSAHKIGGFAPSFAKPLTMSTVGADDPNAWNCPSRFQNNSCGDCRECWDTDQPIVNYHLH